MQISKYFQNIKPPPNLQKHMLRVGAVTQILLDNWIGEDVDKNAILAASLVHDIAKPITFDMSKQMQYLKSESELKNVQETVDFLINNYGRDEHPALNKIGAEIGLNKKTLTLLDNLEWHYIGRLIEENEIESLIVIYCDMRIDPNGIVSMKQRIEDFKIRSGKDNRQLHIDGEILETFINQNVSADLNLIAKQEIEKRVENLSNYSLI